jgi:peptide/nickel transport system permease protein
VAVQYVRWGWNVLRGDLGMSLEHKRPVAEVMGARLFMTILLAVTTIVFTWIMAIPIGIYSAVRQHSMGDYAVTLIGFLGLAVPDFLLGLILLWLVYDRFGVLLDGLFSSQYYSAPWSLGRLWDLMKHIWIPALVLGTSGTAALIRVLRNNLLDELRKPYVTTARAKGVPEWRLVVKYPVRVALGPLISTAAFILPAMLSGTIIVSVVLNLPTLGPVLLQALLAQDTYLAATSVMFLGMFTVVGVLLSDMLLALTDPRARLETT